MIRALYYEAQWLSCKICEQSFTKLIEIFSIQMLTAVFATMLGISFFWYLTASFTAHMANADYHRATYQQKLDSAARYMKVRIHDNPNIGENKQQETKP